MSKGPSSTVIASSYNTTSVDYVANSINTYSPARSMPVNPAAANRLGNNVPPPQNYQEGIVNTVNSSYPHNYVPSTPQNATHVIHQGGGAANKPHQGYNNAEVASTSSNYVYPPQMGMSQSPLMPSLPTPAPTPSPTPTQSPTRYLQRASVITSESTQQNGMYSLPAVDKYLIGDDINLNMPGQSMNVPGMNSPMMMQPNMAGQYSNQSSVMDPATNQPMQIPPQLQSQFESHLQLDAQSHMNVNSQMYPADMLESTIDSSVLGNDVSASIPIISGDLSMTPPLSSSVPQLDSVPNIQGA